MRAVILAGGKGKRLYPYTMVLPKPLAPIGEFPIIEIVVRQLAARGFRRITIAVGHHADLIMAVMGNGSKWGVRIDYAIEDTPLKTAGPLTLIEGLGEEPFLVMNGDLLTDLDYAGLAAFHQRHNPIATVAACERHVQLQLGVLEIGEGGEFPAIAGFREKPRFDYRVSMGIYIFDPRVLDYIPAGEPFGFDDLMARLLDAGETVAAYPFEGHWLDMGTPDDLERAIAEFEQHRNRYLPETKQDE